MARLHRVYRGEGLLVYDPAARRLRRSSSLSRSPILGHWASTGKPHTSDPWGSLRRGVAVLGGFDSLALPPGKIESNPGPDAPRATLRPGLRTSHSRRRWRKDAGSRGRLLRQPQALLAKRQLASRWRPHLQALGGEAAARCRRVGRGVSRFLDHSSLAVTTTYLRRLEGQEDPSRAKVAEAIGL
jgi:hypothetical protein